MNAILSTPSRLATARAIRRAALRKTSAGGIMFIVAMMLSVVSALGVTALIVASNEVKSSGYERQNLQTHYLSEFAVLGTAQDVTGALAGMYLARMMLPATADKLCTSLAPVPVSAGPQPTACYRMGVGLFGTTNYQEIGASWSWVQGGSRIIEPYTVSPSGSLGINLSPDFYVEISDPSRKLPPSGMSLANGFHFVQFTVTTVGLTPSPGALAYARLSEGRETARARISGGPVQWQ